MTWSTTRTGFTTRLGVFELEIVRDGRSHLVIMTRRGRTWEQKTRAKDDALKKYALDQAKEWIWREMGLMQEAIDEAAKGDRL